MIGYTVRLVRVVNYPFLMACRRFGRTGLNSVAWYHCTIYGLVLAARSLNASGCVWLGGWSWFMVRLNLNMPDVFDQVPYDTVRPSFKKLR